jgi:hypothetical protein
LRTTKAFFSFFSEVVPFVVEKQASSQRTKLKALEKAPYDEYRIEKVSPSSSIRIM